MAKNFYYGWLDFDEDDSTDAIPDKYTLTIGTFEDDEFTDEVATIVHRVTPDLPYDGEEMQRKRDTAQHIVNLLNGGGVPS